METPERIAANRTFAEARNLAEGRKQASMALAAKMPMPEHALAVKAADRAFFLDLGAGYHAAAESA
jgi:hypothetical protein